MFSTRLGRGQAKLAVEVRTANAGRLVAWPEGPDSECTYGTTVAQPTPQHLKLRPLAWENHADVQHAFGDQLQSDQARYVCTCSWMGCMRHVCMRLSTGGMSTACRSSSHCLSSAHLPSCPLLKIPQPASTQASSTTKLIYSIHVACFLGNIRLQLRCVAKWTKHI